MVMDRREFLGAAGVAAAAVTGCSDKAPPARNDNAPAAAAKEQVVTHCPENYSEIFQLSAEQKLMLATAVVSGHDAVAFYKPGENGFVLDKHIDLYKQDTAFSGKLDGNTHFQAPGDLRHYNKEKHIVAKTEGGESFHYLPVWVKGSNTPKAVIALHVPNNEFARKEPEYCKDAKLKMAWDVAVEFGDLVGQSGEELRKRQDAHDAWDRRHDFYMQIVKDNFSTLTRAADPKANEVAGIDPQTIGEVNNAKNAFDLKAALRKWQKTTSSDQYSHVLGVTDLMEHTMKLAVNAPDAKIKASPELLERMELLALNHDIKTQMPSQYMAPNANKPGQQENEFATERNGRHPYDNAILLALSGAKGAMDALHSGAHHHGFTRYGQEEIADLKRKQSVGEGFTSFTPLAKDGDVKPEELAPLVRLLRVCDVTEAITGRVNLPLHEAIRQLGTPGTMFEPKDIYTKIRRDEKNNAIINPDTIDPDALCFMIVNGAFKAYGQQRVQETGGWKGRIVEGKQVDKYDEKAVDAIQAKVLKEFGWDTPEGRQEKETAFRKALAEDIEKMEHPAQQAPARTGKAMSM